VIVVFRLTGDGHVRPYFANRAADAMTETIGFSSVEKMIEMSEKQHYLIYDKLVQFVMKTDWDSDPDKTNEYYVSVKGRYFRLRFRRAAKYEDDQAFIVDVEDLTRDEGAETRKRMDNMLRSILNYYDHIYFIHIDNDYAQVAYNGVRDTDEQGTKYYCLSEQASRFAKKYIYGPDRDRFLRYMHRDTMAERIRRSNNGCLIGQFRILDTRGNYVWKLFSTFLTPDSSENIGVLCIRDSILENSDETEKIFIRAEDADALENGNYSDILWKNLTTEMPINLFWKDKDRRFLGESRASSEYLGVNSEDVIGMEDKQMGWGLTDDTFDEMKKRVLNGETVTDYTGKIRIDGTIRNMLVKEVPVYRDGKVRGILGWIQDIEKTSSDSDSLSKTSIIDEASGCMNVRGILEAAFLLHDAYVTNGAEYDAMMIKVSTWDREVREYGKELCAALQKKTGEILRKNAGLSGFLGRLTGGVFVVMRARKDGAEELSKLRDNIVRDLESIHELDGRTLTIRVKTDSISTGDGPDPDELLRRIVSGISNNVPFHDSEVS
jgi:PAS domain S-box-containing protein